MTEGLIGFMAEVWQEQPMRDSLLIEGELGLRASDEWLWQYDLAELSAQHFTAGVLRRAAR